MAITTEEKKRYPLVGKDREILEHIHEVEQMKNLSEDERFVLLFLRTQLEDDWRKHCLDLLDTWMKMRDLPPKKRWGKLKEAHNKWWNPNDV